MKKVVVILLVLSFLGLLGVDGCAPMPGGTGVPSGGGGFAVPSTESKGEDVAKLRGLDIEFLEDSFHFSSIKGKMLPVLFVGDEFDVGVKITNYLLKPVNGNINLYSLSTKSDGSKVIKGSDYFSVTGANVQDDRIFPESEIISFGPFSYDKAEEDSLVVDVSLEYIGKINADMCFTNDENSGNCNNYVTLTENYLKGDAGFLPVSISEIRKEARVKDGIADVRLVIRLRNFDEGNIKNNMLERFDVKIGGVSLSCGNAIFEQGRAEFGPSRGYGEAEVICNGDISFSEVDTTLPSEFDLDYTYEVEKIVKYEAVS
jgi:hypothetical protein